MRSYRFHLFPYCQEEKISLLNRKVLNRIYSKSVQHFLYIALFFYRYKFRLIHQRMLQGNRTLSWTDHNAGATVIALTRIHNNRWLTLLLIRHQDVALTGIYTPVTANAQFWVIMYRSGTTLYQSDCVFLFLIMLHVSAPPLTQYNLHFSSRILSSDHRRNQVAPHG